MRSLLSVAALFLGGCGLKATAVTSGLIAGRQTFVFGNFVSVTVEASAAPFEWRQFHPRDGNALRPPYGEFSVDLPSGRVQLTDREARNGELWIGGTLHRGEAFLLHEDGRIELVPGTSAGAPQAR